MKTTNNWLWIFIILLGFILGGLLGDVFSGNQALSFLSYGKEIGFNADSPMVVDFYIFRLTFGFAMRINVASIIGAFLTMIFYKLLRK